MTLRERLLYHHAHPAKLVVDAIAAIVAAVLLWQQHLIRAAAVGLGVPAIASACVLWFADVETLKELRGGRSEARTVTSTMMLVRIAGVFVFWGGAWYRSVTVCLAGLVVIALTWVRVNLSTESDRARLLSTSARGQLALISRALENQKHIIAFALLFSSLVNVIVFYLGGHSFRGYLVENSDILYLPTLFSDLISKGGRISDWFLTPAPYFFPDYPTYLIAYILGSGTYSRIAIFSVAQTILTFCAIWLLAKRVSQSEALIHAVTITIGLIWLALSAGEPFVILLASASHYGSFISAIIFAALWIQYKTPREQPGKGGLLSVMCILAFLSTLSDNFFIVQVTVPFVATAILVELADSDVPIRQGRARLIAAWVLLALVVPALMYRMPIPPPVINVAWSSAVDDQQRATLEARFHLTGGDFRGGRLWTYQIGDTTRANVGALVSHPAVEDTQHIDRRSFAVDRASGPLWRAVSTLPIGLVVSTFAVLGWAFISGIWSDLRQRLSITTKVFVLLPAVFSALGSISYNFVVANPTRYPPSIGLEKTYGNLTDLYVGIQRTVTNNLAYGIVLVGYLGVVMFLLYGRIGRSTNKNYPRQLAWLAVFSSLSLCATLTAASLVTDFPVMPRYLIPAFSWPVVIVVLFLGHYLGRRFFAVGTVVSALAVVLLTSSSYKLAHNNGLSARFYPSEISCIDDALEKEGLRNGIAQYWDAKYLQQFSRLDLTIAQYLENLEEMKWITSKRYFRDSYDFAIIAEDAEPTYKISSEALLRINGSPKQVVSCGNRSVYIYGKDKLRTTSGKT
jgi:hypothetical protein